MAPQEMISAPPGDASRRGPETDPIDLSYFDHPAWCQGMTLSERIASLRDAPHRTPNGAAPSDLARRRLQRWQSQAPFSEGSLFAQRLAAEGIGEEELLTLLGEPVEALHARFPTPPAWWVELAEAFSQPVSEETDPVLMPEAHEGRGAIGFLVAIEPLIRRGRDRLREGVRALARTRPELPFDPKAIEGMLLPSLWGQLIPKVSRTMVLELNVARLEELLVGETTEERFASFVHRLRQPDVALALLQEYPVLSRQLMICVDHWARLSLELLQHLCADWEAIRAALSPDEDPGTLVEVDGFAGDRHRGGRAVGILRFSSGFRVVYKPRSLAVERHFQELLAWLNERSDLPPFRTLTVLDRANYGWVEFVSAQPCSSAEEVRRFYERLGGYLALLYALEATDFHFENLLAAGEHPVLLDLESLFHPRLRGLDLREQDALGGDALAYSVLRVGLLPQRVWSPTGRAATDVSGLGAKAGQPMPYRLPDWEAEGTDEMRFTRRLLTMPAIRSRPTLHGEDVDVVDYSDAISAGFAALYRSLLNHREELLSDAGPLACFAGDEVRVILRPTSTYGTLLLESFHPDVLRNALDRDRFFDRLWTEVAQRPDLVRVIRAEQDDLLRGDIPLFTTRPGSTDLWTSADERFADFIDEPGFHRAQQHLQQLSEVDLVRQCWFIQATLATLPMESDAATPRALDRMDRPNSLDRGRLLETAGAVGDRLAALALHGDRDVSWVGLTPQLDEHEWVVLPLAADLYGGLPGVALFLAYLGAVTGEARHTALAQAALDATRRQVEASRTTFTWVGGFLGWGGLIYTLTHLGMLWDQPALLAEAEAIVAELPPWIEQDEQLDVIAGSAGCIGALLSLYRCVPSPNTLAAAVQCGDRLLARAQKTEHGIGWITLAAGDRPLAGFSHGAAGIAWALLELAALTGEERFRAAALAAIADERALFSSEAENWLDLRETGVSSQEGADRANTSTTAWCHGAPGVGLGRLLSLSHLDDPTVREEIEIALRTTIAQGFGGSHCLCHGDLGNLELLLQAGQTLGDPRWHEQAEHVGAMVLESIIQTGCRCGVPMMVEVPGLMTGLAGIGYELLRLADPTRVPSVLALAPPVK